MYAIDVHHLQGFFSEDGKGRAHLYLDGTHHGESELPAAFPVRGGTIEIVPTPFGLKRCHYVPTRGLERQLVPDQISAKGRRARLSGDRPGLCRWIGAISLVVLIVSLLLLILQFADAVFLIPPVIEHIGTFESPIHLPVWLNIALGLTAAAASTERALRLRHHWLLDTAG